MNNDKRLSEVDIREIEMRLNNIMNDKDLRLEFLRRPVQTLRVQGISIASDRAGNLEEFFKSNCDPTNAEISEQMDEEGLPIEYQRSQMIRS